MSHSFLFFPCNYLKIQTGKIRQLKSRSAADGVDVDKAHSDPCIIPADTTSSWPFPARRLVIRQRCGCRQGTFRSVPCRRPRRPGTTLPDFFCRSPPLDDDDSETADGVDVDKAAIFVLHQHQPHLQFASTQHLDTHPVTPVKILT